MSRRGLPGRDEDPTSRGVPVLPGEGVHECEGGWVRSGVPCRVCKPHLRWVVDSRTGRGRWRVDESRLPARGRRRVRKGAGS